MTSLLTLKDPRTDAPMALPSPASSGVRFEFLNKLETDFENVVVDLGLEDNKPVDPALAGFVHVALLRKLSASSPTERDNVIAEAQGVQSNEDAVRYIQKVRKGIRAKI